MADVKTGRINDIEALRAVAIGFTLLMHMSWLFSWGNKLLDAKNYYFNFSTGVDLFFAISGFVIARGLLSEMNRAQSVEHRSAAIAAFWIRRIFRIWPVSWFWLFVLGIWTVLVRNDPHGFASMSTQFNDIVAALLQVANFHWWQCVADRTTCGQTLIWWSLSLEEQFYIALPIAIIVFRRRLHLVLIALVLIQFFLPRPAASASLLWWIRTDAIALGVLLAMFERTSVYLLLQPTFMAKRRYGLPAVLLIILLLGACTGIPSLKPDPAFFSTGIAAVLSALLVLIASYNKGYVLSSKWLTPPVLWLGSRSFAIYLIHTMMFGWTRLIWGWIEPAGTVFTGRFTLRFFLTWLILTIVFAELSYRLIEIPMREKGRKFARQILSRAQSFEGSENVQQVDRISRRASG